MSRGGCFVGVVGLLVGFLIVSSAGAATVQVGLEGTGEDLAVRLSWESVEGERYEIRSAGSLQGEVAWELLDTEPLIGNGGTIDYRLAVDPATPLSFFQLVTFAEAAAPPPVIQDGVVRPESPYVALGRQVGFTAAFPDGSAPVWDLFGLESLDVGRLTEAGVYTAPTTLPELPFAGIQAQSSAQPDRVNSTTAILLPADEIRISREQAIAILQSTIIDPHPRKSELLAMGLHQPLTRADDLRVFDPNREVGGSDVSASDPCWFFLVDEDPSAAWAHPVRYVKIDCRSGDLLMNQQELWYPELNGQPFWHRVVDRQSMQDRVFVGETVAPELEPPVFELVPVDLGNLGPLAPRNVHQPIVRRQDEFIPIPRMFPPAANACNCPGTARRHALIGVMSPEEDPLLISGDAWERLFRKNAFQTQLVFDGSVSTVRKKLDAWRTSVRPCDVVVVMLLGHGIGGSVSGISSSELVTALRLIPTNAKYLVLEACDAGFVFDIFKKATPTPQVGILTATNKMHPDGIPLIGTSPINVAFDNKSGFTRALMACFSRFDTLEEVHKCLTSVSDIGPGATRMKLADPQFERVGAADTDQDGVLDAVEKKMGLDPLKADTDGDGVCDGIEVGQTAALELRIGDTRGDLALRGQRKPTITSSTAPPRVLNNETYELKLSVKGGIPFRTGAVSFDNPFGIGPQNGWFLEEGALPEGVRLDRMTGLIRGTPTSFGSFPFKVKYVDAIGVSATASFQMRSVNIIGTTGRVRVSSAGDTNQRDDHITLREAVLLCTGKLSQDDLREDPDLTDNKPAGEKRWISGEFGAPFHNTIVFEEPMTIRLTEGPLVFDTHASTLVMGEKHIRIEAGSGPVFDFQGDRNTLQDISFIKVGSGPGIRVSGEGNYIGEPFSLWQHPSVVLEGGGLGIGVEVTGKRNTIASFSVEGFDIGVLLRSEAAYNTIDSMRCGKNRIGMELRGKVTHNRIFDCRMGVAFAETADHLPRAVGNTGHGLYLHEGAQFNVIEACGMASNGGVGVLVDGAETDSNQFLGLEIGTTQSFRSVGGTVLPNTGGGIIFQNGSSDNVVRECLISDNGGHGIILSGVGTDFNDIGDGGEKPVKIDKPSDSGDGVVIKDGASDNALAIEIERSGSDGVVILGQGTSDNFITCRKYSTILSDFVVPSMVKQCAGVGIFIGGGATDNHVEEWTRVENCGSGIVLDGPGTEENWVEMVVVKASKTNAIRVSGRAQRNQLGPDLALQGSGGSAILITGAGTDYNQVVDSFKISEVPHGRYAVELTRGAKYNTVEGLFVGNISVGGMALIGSGTQFNRILGNDIMAGFGAQTVENSSGLLIADGASRNFIWNNQIGGGNGDGIRIQGEATQSNTIDGNTIYGFKGNGILIDDSAGNLIGGVTSQGNRIEDNGLAGVRIQGANAKGNRVMGNNIGNTSFRSGNRGHGVVIEGASDNQVGGIRPVTRDPSDPSRRLPPNPEEKGAANVIVGNAGDGVRISGGRGNRVLGNIIGAEQIGFFANDYGNGGDGVHILGGSQAACVGNCVSLAERAIGWGNVIERNHGVAVRIVGDSTSGIAVRENNVFLNMGGRVLLEQGGNSGVALPEVGVDPATGTIVGRATRRGYIEVYSDSPGAEGTYHLTAVVGRGPFEIDRFEPRVKSKNALILQQEVDIPVGKIYLSFTEYRTGNSSEFVELE